MDRPDKQGRPHSKPQPQPQPQPQAHSHSHSQSQSQSQSQRQRQRQCHEPPPCALVLGSVAGTALARGDEGPSDRHSRVRSCKVQSIAIDVANTHFSEVLSVPLVIRTDGTFDGLVPRLSDALEVGRFLRLQMRSLGVDARVVIAAVMLFDARDEHWAQLLGEGFVEARRKLVGPREAGRYGFSVPGRLQLERLLEAVGRTLGDIESGWTEAQFGYVLEVLLGRARTRAEVAKALGVTQNSLFKGLRAARHARYIEQFEAVRVALEIEDHRRDSYGHSGARSCHGERAHAGR